jgi:hypothetical protein
MRRWHRDGRTSPWIQSLWTPPRRRPTRIQDFPARAPPRQPHHCVSEPRNGASARGWLHAPTNYPAARGTRHGAGVATADGPYQAAGRRVRVEETTTSARTSAGAVQCVGRIGGGRPLTGQGSGGARRVRTTGACSRTRIRRWGCGRAGGRGRASATVLGWCRLGRFFLLQWVPVSASAKRPNFCFPKKK